MEAVLSSSRSRQVNIYFTPAVEDRRRTLSSHPPELDKKIYRIIRGLPHASAWESFRSLRGKVRSISSLARQPVKPPPIVNLNSIHNNQEHFHTDYTVQPGCLSVILIDLYYTHAKPLNRSNQETSLVSPNRRLLPPPF